MDAKSFTIKCDLECCELCLKTYDGGSVFLILNKKIIILPLHDEWWL